MTPTTSETPDWGGNPVRAMRVIAGAGTGLNEEELDRIEAYCDEVVPSMKAAHETPDDVFEDVLEAFESIEGACSVIRQAASELLVPFDRAVENIVEAMQALPTPDGIVDRIAASLPKEAE